jgi:hypothetical protein
MAIALCFFAAVFAATPAAAQSQWVVDAAGGGDFTNLQVAVDQAAPGDVLLVQPGTYASVVINKRLRVLGNPAAARPVTTVIQVKNASSFTLSHFQASRLVLQDLAGSVVVDGCSMGFSGIEITNCPNVLLSRTDVTAGGGGEFANDAVSAVNSRIQVVACNLIGGTSLSAWGGTVGGSGLSLGAGSKAWISASSVRGGDGLDHWQTGSVGDAGHALLLYGGSTADVRGGPQHKLEQGYSIGTIGAGGIGWAVKSNGSSATVSGVTVIGGMQNTQPHDILPAPFLDVGGSTGPGKNFRALLYGASGEPAVLVAGLVPSTLDLPVLLSTPLWVAPGEWIFTVPMVLQGLSTPAVFSLVQPPSTALAGLTLYLQGAQLLPSGGAFGTNAGALVLSW